MKLSVRGEYAVRALLVLGARPRRQLVTTPDISREQNIPKRFLEQILADLRSAGVVESRRGVAGGYRLAMAAERITLAQVIRHVDGALAPVSCVSERFYEKCSCPDETRCPLRAVMKEVRDEVSLRMERTTLADLIQRGKELEKHPLGPADYSI